MTRAHQLFYLCLLIPVPVDNFIGCLFSLNFSWMTHQVSFSTIKIPSTVIKTKKSLDTCLFLWKKHLHSTQNTLTKIRKPKLRVTETRCFRSPFLTLRRSVGCQMSTEVLAASLHVLFLRGSYLTQLPLRDVCMDTCAVNSVCVRKIPWPCWGKKVRPLC